jgi:hypothetical protein
MASSLYLSAQRYCRSAAGARGSVATEACVRLQRPVRRRSGIEQVGNEFRRNWWGKGIEHESRLAEVRGQFSARLTILRHRVDQGAVANAFDKKPRRLVKSLRLWRVQPYGERHLEGVAFPVHPKEARPSMCPGHQLPDHTAASSRLGEEACDLPRPGAFLATGKFVGKQRARVHLGQCPKCSVPK